MVAQFRRYHQCCAARYPGIGSAEGGKNIGLGKCDYLKIRHKRVLRMILI